MRLIIIVSILLILSMSVASENDIMVSSVKAYNWNKFLNDLVEIELEIRYDQADDYFYLFIPDLNNPCEITLSDEFRQELSKLMRTFERKDSQGKSWEKKFDEELGTLPTADSRFKKGSSWYTSRVNTAANIFSQTSQMHQFILFFSKMQANENDHFNFQIKPLYFGQKEVSEFRKILAPRIFEKYQKKE